jgi:16S rRNA (cytosine967-C5)-methyltransferase
MKFNNQLRYCTRIVESYTNKIPLEHWLKNYFRENPQMGSRDRKLMTGMTYSFYRVGHSLLNLSLEDRILAGLFLCSDTPQELLGYFRPSWNEAVKRPPEEKYCLIDTSQSPALIFPWHEELSAGIDASRFSASHLVQPDLFIRIRPGHLESVLEKIAGAGWNYEWIAPWTVRLPNGTKTENVLALDREAVVQDLASQTVGILIQQVLQSTVPEGARVWDCCAGSGGKSLMLHDLFPGAGITASDLRPSILINLRKRFAQAGIRNYEIAEADLTKNTEGISPGSFDIILADVPCSGSGTWGRNPERLYFYKQELTKKYRRRQEEIVSHAIRRLRNGGVFIYATCSVFREENEEMSEFIRKREGLNLLKQELLRGYEQRADSMFTAIFRK